MSILATLLRIFNTVNLSRRKSIRLFVYFILVCNQKIITSVMPLSGLNYDCPTIKKLYPQGSETCFIELPRKYAEQFTFKNPFF